MEIKTSVEVKQQQQQQQQQPESQRPLAGFLETMCPIKHNYRIIVNRIITLLHFIFFTIW